MTPGCRMPLYLPHLWPTQTTDDGISTDSDTYSAYTAAGGVACAYKWDAVIAWVFEYLRMDVH